MPKYFEINKNNFQKSLGYYPVVAWGKLYRASFLKENCVQFVDKNIIHEDDGFYIKTMSLYPKIACVEGVGVNYRIRNNSIMNELCEDKNKKDLIISLNDAFDFINDKRVIKKVKNSKIYSKYFNVWKKAYCCLKEFLTKR